jgi:hypothetical protein
VEWQPRAGPLNSLFASRQGYALQKNPDGMVLLQIQTTGIAEELRLYLQENYLYVMLDKFEANSGKGSLM